MLRITFLPQERIESDSAQSLKPVSDFNIGLFPGDRGMLFCCEFALADEHHTLHLENPDGSRKSSGIYPP
jgi:hypothetical protein